MELQAQPLFDWMEGRELVRQKRASGAPPPWTDDPVLHKGYFTNVMREHDKVSVWIQANITDPYAWHDDLPLMLALARHLNRISTLNEISYAGMWKNLANPKEWDRLIELLEDTPRPIYGGGYVISAAGMQHASYQSKEEYVCTVARGVLGLRNDWPLDSLEQWTGALAALPGWGAFMAYEVACDLRWAPGWLDSAPDIYRWANPGPGARKGVQVLTGMPASPSATVKAMQRYLGEAGEYPWKVQWVRPLEMRDIEHSLCEYQKYDRAVRTGKMKRWYWK